MTIIQLAALAAAAQAGATEWIGRAELPGFVVGHEAEAPQGMIVERVPEGETVRAWTRTVTVQRFAGVAGRLRPDELLQNMAGGLPRSCPGAVASPIEIEISGRAAARFRADGPLLAQTGLPETFFALAIAGETDMHMLQVAFRRVPSADDAAWAQAQLASAALCTARSREPGCRR